MGDTISLGPGLGRDIPDSGLVVTHLLVIGKRNEGVYHTLSMK